MADFYNTLQGTTGAQMNNATQPLNSATSGGKGTPVRGGKTGGTNNELNSINASKTATNNLNALRQQAAEAAAAAQSPTPGQATPAIPGSVFGNAATEPVSVANMTDKINGLLSTIDTTQNNLLTAQSAYNKLAKQKVAQNNRWGGTNPAYTEWQNKLNSQKTKVANLQKQLTKNQNDFQRAITRQQDLNAAGQDAVNWGLAAKAAEENGLRNATQAYQQGMANAGVRNAIMNAAINTVGNGGGGK